MATVTKTYTDNYYPSATYRKTWTVTYAFTDITATSSTFTFNTPNITAKFAGSAGYYTFMEISTPHGSGDDDGFIIGGKTLPSGNGWLWSNNQRSGIEEIYYQLSPNTTYTVAKRSGSDGVATRMNHTQTLNTADFYTASNKTTKVLNVVMHLNPVFLCTSTDSSGTNNWSSYQYYDSTPPITPLSYTVGTVTLNAPPTVTLGTPTYSTPHYAGLGTYSVPITQAKALYGGDISKITLTVGSDTVSQSYSASTVSNQTLSLVPSQAGTFTPTIKVTDSRGQTKTQSLTAITVNAYAAPNMSFDISRCNNSGKLQAEGEHGLVTAKISYTDAIANLTQPTVSVEDENGNTVASTVTWYETWDSVNGLSDAVNWTNYQPASPVTLYALVSATGGIFSTNESYTVSITPSDNMGGVAQTITQTLSTGFFTIDFQAGGKEIAFGAPANDLLTNYPDGLFKCEMDAIFNNDAVITNPYYALDTTQPVGTTDGDLYAAINGLGWSSDVIV